MMRFSRYSSWRAKGGVAASVLVSGALVLSGCGGSGSSTNTNSASSETLTIPYLASAAGPAAGFKQDIIVPPKIVEAEVNGANGPKSVPKLTFKRLEANLDPAQAVRNFRQVMKSDPVAILGVESTTAAAIAPLANTAKVPFIATGASKVEIASQNRPWVFTPWADQNKIQGDAVKEWLKREPQVKQVVLIENEQEAASDTQGEAAAAGLRGTSAKLVSKVTFDTNTTDFAPLVTRAASQHPDGIIVASTPPEAAAIDQAIAKQRLNVSVYQIQNSLAQGFFQNVGNAANGYYGGTTFFAGADTPTVQKYVKSFEADSGGVRPTYPQIYDGFQFLVKALEKVNLSGMSPTDARDAIRRALDSVCITAVTGNKECFNDQGYVEKAPILLKIGKGGAVSVVKGSSGA